MFSLIASSELAVNKTRWGDIARLTHVNYNQWKDNMILVLSAMRAYAIVTGDDPEPQPLDFDHVDNYDDWKVWEAEAACIIRLSCSPEVWCINKGIRNPHDMWNTPETSLDTAGPSISRQDILRQFRACWPKEDEPLKAYFTKLRNYRIQLDHTDDAITNQDCSTQSFTSLPSQYAMISIVLKHRRPLPTSEEAMHDLLEEQTTVSLTNELEDASTGATLLSRYGGYRGQGKGCECGGRNSGTGDSHESKCLYCKIDSHTTDACRKRRHAQQGENNGNNEHIYIQCGLPAHIKIDCVSYNRINEWWRVKNATITAALPTTGDCDFFWLTAWALTAAAATPNFS